MTVLVACMFGCVSGSIVTPIAQLFNIFAAVVVGDKICTVSLALRIASVLRGTQTLFPVDVLHSNWVALDAGVRAVIEKLLADSAAASPAPGTPASPVSPR